MKSDLTRYCYPERSEGSRQILHFVQNDSGRLTLGGVFFTPPSSGRGGSGTALLYKDGRITMRPYKDEVKNTSDSVN